MILDLDDIKMNASRFPVADTPLYKTKAFHITCTISNGTEQVPGMIETPDGDKPLFKIIAFTNADGMLYKTEASIHGAKFSTVLKKYAKYLINKYERLCRTFVDEGTLPVTVCKELCELSKIITPKNRTAYTVEIKGDILTVMRPEAEVKQNIGGH